MEGVVERRGWLGAEESRRSRRKMVAVCAASTDCSQGRVKAGRRILHFRQTRLGGRACKLLNPPSRFPCLAPLLGHHPPLRLAEPSNAASPTRCRAQVHAGTHVEVEAFVHGALCVSYSGQCFSSEAWGGRSANRGQCAQACRLPYGLIEDGQIKVRAHGGLCISFRPSWPAGRRVALGVRAFLVRQQRPGTLAARECGKGPRKRGDAVAG